MAVATLRLANPDGKFEAQIANPEMLARRREHSWLWGATRVFFAGNME